MGELIRGSLLECLSHRGVVGIWEASALDHQNVDQPGFRVSPAIVAYAPPWPYVPERHHLGHALRLLNNLKTKPPTHPGDKPGLYVTCLCTRQFLH